MTPRPLAGLAALALPLAACRNSQAGGQASPPRLPTKAEYVAQADELCTEARRNFDELPKYPHGLLKLNLFDVAADIEQITRIAREREERIQALPKPPEHAATLEAIEREAMRAIELGDEVVEGAREGDERRRRVALRERALTNDSRLRMRQDFGFSACAEGAPISEHLAYAASVDDVCAKILPKINRVVPPEPATLGGPTAAEYAFWLAPLVEEFGARIRAIPARPESVPPTLLEGALGASAELQRTASTIGEQAAERGSGKD